jgi:hypothetical protein
MVQGDLKKEKENSYYAKEQARLQRKKGNEKLSEEELKKRVPALTQHQIDAMTMDKAVLTRLQKQKAEYIQTVFTTPSATSSRMDEHGSRWSAQITTCSLVPRLSKQSTREWACGAVPLRKRLNEKLVEFLREKLSFSTAQARTVTKGLCELRTAVHQHNRPKVLLHSPLLRISVT